MIDISSKKLTNCTEGVNMTVVQYLTAIYIYGCIQLNVIKSLTNKYIALFFGWIFWWSTILFLLNGHGCVPTYLKIFWHISWNIETFTFTIISNPHTPFTYVDDTIWHQRPQFSNLLSFETLQNCIFWSFAATERMSELARLQWPYLQFGCCLKSGIWT